MLAMSSIDTTDSDSSDMAESDSTSKLREILQLLELAGFEDAGRSDVSVYDKIIRGLSWCITANSSLEAVSNETSTLLDKIENGKRIEEALSSLRCPYHLRASQMENVDCEAILPVVGWLISNRTQMSCAKDMENNLQQLEDELNNKGVSIKILRSKLDEQKERKINELQQLRDRINDAGATTMVEILISLIDSLKVLERKELKFQSNCDTEHSKLQAEIIELENLLATGSDDKSFNNILNCSLQESLANLNLARKELSAKLKAILSVKRQIDDVPTQSELIQYELRFAELYVHIQDKHQQTQKYYATYNTLLEIKELMLKEISLLNSISSQFRDAIATTAGRLKLIDSMEGIMKSSQQKLEKVQRGLQEEQKVCDALKVRYSAAVAGQRQCSSLLKTLQEECVKNDRLQSQGALHRHCNN